MNRQVVSTPAEIKTIKPIGAPAGRKKNAIICFVIQGIILFLRHKQMNDYKSNQYEKSKEGSSGLNANDYRGLHRWMCKRFGQ